MLSKPDWLGIERLSFNLLIPALIINAIYQSDLSLKSSGPYVLAIILGLCSISILTLLLRLLIAKPALSGPQLSSMFQATTRWNALITLPIAAQLFGTRGLTVVAIAMAFMIPLINVVNIAVISGLHAGNFRIVAVLKTIAKNPLIIACAIGLALNFAKFQPPVPIQVTLDMISRGALAIGLLCIGAGFDWRRLLRPTWQIIWCVAAKNIAAPLLVFGLAVLFGLGPLETLCAMLVVATPTATNGYIVARQMGGDAELYAYIMSWQLVAAVLTFPLMIYFVQG